MKASSLRIVTAWLQGHADAGIDLNGGIELPMFLKPQLTDLLQAAVLSDENRPADADPFERFGVWHRAVLRVMPALSAECRAMTAHYEYPHGLGLADGAFMSFMSAIRAFRIELPSAEALAAADAERAQAAKRVIVAQKHAFGELDDSSYDYT